VSDAGTPAINDPGFVIVKMAIEAGIEVVPIPGAVAFVSAAIASGLSTESIYFGGFLPSKSGERRKRLADVAGVPATLIFYESPNRLARSLADCIDVLGNRMGAYSRELTKLHEQTVRGRLSDLLAAASAGTVKGEIVLMIDRAHGERTTEHDVADLAARVRELEAGGADPRAALKQAAREFGVGKSEAYRIVQAGKNAASESNSDR
jgi:16S rRNA (cytidine1402-2'-O)-methyltransferase